MATKTAVVIRPATSSDLNDISELEDCDGATPRWSHASLADELSNPGTFFRIARKDFHTVGFIACSAVGNEGEVRRLVVTPSERNQGVGSSLLYSALEAWRKLDVQRVFLEVRPSNHRARSLYEKYGFIVAGRRTDYFQDPAEDALLLLLHMKGP